MKTTQTTVVLVALLVACVTVQTGSSYSELERYPINYFGVADQSVHGNKNHYRH